MDEISRYAVGLDIGTGNVRAVAASIAGNGNLSVIGYGEAVNSGMRRGVVVNLAGPMEAINKALAAVEPMSGYEVNSAVISINGVQIVSTRVDGMIAVRGETVTEDDLARVEDVALSGQNLANQMILSIVPLQYTIDGQTGIRNPLGMTGAKLQMKANVISTLTPSYNNLLKVVEGMKVPLVAEQVVPSVMGAAKAVLTERQRENGVVVIDIGASTTGVAVFEENDLQYIGVVPVGSNNITNDLAVMLAIDTEVAEEIKRRFASANFGATDSPVVIRWRGKELRFAREQIDEVVEARLNEIMDLVRKEIKKAHYDQRLPEGAVLTGGGARMRDIDKFVREKLEMSVKIGVPTGLSGVADAIQKPEYATAVGLMLTSAEGSHTAAKAAKKGKKKSGGGFFAKVFSKF